ncbi:MAG: hypothetical protein KGL39_10365 [Patescibacteria group bacterium]|nr:hypothetical protein [Patescibacteria group bacterium]
MTSVQYDVDGYVTDGPYKGYHRMHIAVMWDDIDYVRNNHNHVNVRSTGMFTPLHKAAQRRAYKIAKVLITGGADVNLVSSYDYAALHYAVDGPTLADRKIAELLLWNGANVNYRPTTGWVPLAIALIYSKRLVDTLLEFGARVRDLAPIDLMRCSPANLESLERARKWQES